MCIFLCFWCLDSFEWEIIVSETNKMLIAYIQKWWLEWQFIEVSYLLKNKKNWIGVITLYSEEKKNQTNHHIVNLTHILTATWICHYLQRRNCLSVHLYQYFTLDQRNTYAVNLLIISTSCTLVPILENAHLSSLDKNKIVFQELSVLPLQDGIQSRGWDKS